MKMQMTILRRRSGYAKRGLGLLLAGGLLAFAAPMVDAQNGTRGGGAPATVDTTRPGGTLSAPGELAAPYGGTGGQLGTTPGSYGVQTPTGPGVTYGTRGQLGTGLGQLGAPYGTGSGQLGQGAGALSGQGMTLTSPSTNGSFGAGALPPSASTPPSMSGQGAQGASTPPTSATRGVEYGSPGAGQFGQGSGAYGPETMGTPNPDFGPQYRPGDSPYSPQGPLGRATPLPNPQAGTPNAAGSMGY